MMELRPLQAALLAGRAASRRAIAGPSPLSLPLAAPSFYRCFSSTRPSLSEAEAAAPPPTPSMQEWSNRQQQQQQQQQQQSQQQPYQPAWGRPAGTSTSTSTSTGTSAALSSLLRPAAPAPPPTTTQPGTTPTTAAAAPAPATERGRNPWASPSSAALRHAQEKRAAAASATLNEDLNDLGMILGSGPDAKDLMMSDLDHANNVSVHDVKYRLRPSVGRTIHLDRVKVDLARGLALLNLRVRTNRVSQDVMRQRFHERPGLKRKRLRRERWRVNFKDGFKATCKRVQDLARQGW